MKKSSVGTTRRKRKTEIILNAGGARNCPGSILYLGQQRPGDDPLGIFRDFSHKPRDVAAQLVFGGCSHYENALEIMGGACWPLMWMQGDSCDGRHVAGTQALVARGADIRRLEWDGRIIGSSWSDADADYCCMAGVLPDDLTAPRAVQTLQVFQRMERTLAVAGMEFRDVVRTWLFLDHLLDWYGEFNAVRTEFFQKHGIFDHIVPASTGIGARNTDGAALVAGAIAIRPKHAGVTIRSVDSPLQCPAPNYRSSFSRAVELAYPDRRHLMVSGTASIAPDGSTMYLGDSEAQINLTLKVVQAILESRGMTWRSVVRGIAYFENMTDVPLFADCCRYHGITDLPVIEAHATVCRSDLLFELEVDAVDNTTITKGCRNFFTNSTPTTKDREPRAAPRKDKRLFPRCPRKEPISTKLAS